LFILLLIPLIAIASPQDKLQEPLSESYISQVAIPVTVMPTATPTPVPVIEHIAHEQATGMAYIIARESGGSVTAKNPTSTAFGKYQMLEGNRRLYAPICDTTYDTIDEKAQDCMGERYISDRYSSVAKAVEHHRLNNWY